MLKADVQEISGETYIVFGIILFFWELLPTSLVVVFFRVQRPNQNLVKQQVRSANLEWTFSEVVNLWQNVNIYASIRLQEAWSTATVSAPGLIYSTIPGGTIVTTTCPEASIIGLIGPGGHQCFQFKYTIFTVFNSLLCFSLLNSSSFNFSSPQSPVYHTPNGNIYLVWLHTAQRALSSGGGVRPAAAIFHGAPAFCLREHPESPSPPSQLLFHPAEQLPPSPSQ